MVIIGLKDRNGLTYWTIAAQTVIIYCVIVREHKANALAKDAI